jgi:hypothetical protein
MAEAFQRREPFEGWFDNTSSARQPTPARSVSTTPAIGSGPLTTGIKIGKAIPERRYSAIRVRRSAGVPDAVNFATISSGIAASERSVSPRL